MTVKFGPKSTEMEDLYKLISLSRISLLGYTTKYETRKDEIILNLNCTKLNPGDSISSIRRDSIISNILDMGDNIQNLVIDISEIRYNINKNSTFLAGSKHISKIIRSLQDELYAGIPTNNYRLLIVSQIYNKIGPESIPSSDLGFTPNSLLYRCDLAFTLCDNGIDIIKNRFG